MNMLQTAALAAIALGALQTTSQATQKVFLDFSGDWITELNFATTAIGTPNFSPSERTIFQDGIVSELNRIFSDYQINFFTANPSGDHIRVDFAATDGGNGTGVQGSTPTLAIGNFGTNQEVSVLLRNFGFILQSSTLANRAAGLAITVGDDAAHELGHNFGMFHQHIYGAAGISPANYSNTAGLQNGSMMTTSTFNVAKNLNPFEKAIMDIAGGTAMGGKALVTNPVIEANEAGDAGATPATAMPMWFGEGESSGQRVAMQRGNLDGNASDIDVYKFTVLSGGSLSVNVMSQHSDFNITGATFNARLRLIGPDGTSVLADFDDLYYAGNVYNAAQYVDQGGFTINVPLSLRDPFMINFPISTPGEYYLEVSPMGDNDIGDGYQMLSQFSGTVLVPEPASIGLIAGAALLAMRRRNRA